MRKTLLWHVGAAGFAVFVIDAPITAKTWVQGVEEVNVFLHKTQVLFVALRLLS